MAGRRASGLDALPGHGGAQAASMVSTLDATKLEHDRPPVPNRGEKEDQHESSDINVPTLWSLL